MLYSQASALYGAERKFLVADRFGCVSEVELNVAAEENKKKKEGREKFDDEYAQLKVHGVQRLLGHCSLLCGE